MQGQWLDGGIGQALCNPRMPGLGRRKGWNVVVGRFWVAGCLVALAGCVPTGGGIRSVALLDGAMVAAAPAGYCIAPGAGRRGADSAVVLMGRCSAGSEAEPAVLTLSVGAAGSAGAMTAGGEALVAYFRSAEGRAALSRDGRAGDVRVIEAVGLGDAFLLHVEDRAVGDYWRALAGVRGRLVTVSASGPEGQALPAGKGRALVEAAIAALKRANAAGQS
jgi:hypothetical protein